MMLTVDELKSIQTFDESNQLKLVFVAKLANSFWLLSQEGEDDWETRSA